MDKLDQLRADINCIDRDMAELFERRMELARRIGTFKRENGLPILDRGRESDVISRNAVNHSDAALLPYYTAFQQGLMDISKKYQASLSDEETGACSVPGCDVILERGSLTRAAEYLDLQRNVLIVTDDGVPVRYADTLAGQCGNASVFTVPRGEGSKSFAALEQLLKKMLDFGLTRHDCVVAVGGGMAGDLAGFAASIYMRGIDFYNVPTTLLAQVDSSVGGKTAINFDGVKNPIGTFSRPRRVLIDPDVLATLPRRQLSAGLAEVVKMAMTCDRDLFTMLECTDPIMDLSPVIERALAIKAQIVAADEKENGLRRVLNFGHTIGHAIEATRPELLHGECVALGMIPMCRPDAATRLVSLLKRLDLPTSCELDRARIRHALCHDKKSDAGRITVTEVTEIGRFTMRRAKPEELMERLHLIEKGADEG